MKVLLVNGSPHKEGCTYTALKEAAGVLEKQGIETEIFWLGVGEIAGCIGCGACEHLCPARPHTAIYVQGHEAHRTI